MKAQMSKTRTPEQRRFNSPRKRGKNSWGDLIASIHRFTPDFMAERDQLNKQTVAKRN
jgi:hypothetical protein